MSDQVGTLEAVRDAMVAGQSDQTNRLAVMANEALNAKSVDRERDRNVSVNQTRSEGAAVNRVAAKNSERTTGGRG
jgi:hypothetical protein